MFAGHAGCPLIKHVIQKDMCGLTKAVTQEILFSSVFGCYRIPDNPINTWYGLLRPFVQTDDIQSMVEAD